jgi:ubiquitin-protein ligase
MTMELNDKRLGEEQEMLQDQFPNFALDPQKRECVGQVFSHLPSRVYRVTIALPEQYPEEPPSVSINFPQDPAIDYFVGKEFSPDSLTNVTQWSSQNYLKDIIREIVIHIRDERERLIAEILRERDILSKKKPNFGFTKDFTKCKGKIFSKTVPCATYNVEILITPRILIEPPEVTLLAPGDPLLAHWVDTKIDNSELSILTDWKNGVKIVDLIEELTGLIYSREGKAEKVIRERDILTKRAPTFGFLSDGTTCKGKIYSILGGKAYEVVISLPPDFPLHPPGINVIPPSDSLIKTYVNTQFNPVDLEALARWNSQIHIIDAIDELQTLIRSREDLLRRMIDERHLVRKKWPNFGFTSDMKECNGVVYVPNGNKYQIIINLKGFPQAAPKVRAQGVALPNQVLDLPIVRDWNPSITVDMLLNATEMKIRQIYSRHTMVTRELQELQRFWRSMDFLPGTSQRARGSATFALPSGDCNVTLDITFPPEYPEAPPLVSLNATGFKSAEIKQMESLLRRRLSSSSSEFKKVSDCLKQLPQDLISVLVGTDPITGSDFREEVRRNLPIYYCKKCLDTPSKRVCYFHKTSLDRLILEGGKCIMYRDITISETDIGSLQPGQ